MEKLKRLELIQRSLGLRHKIKVHDSMKSPETHEDLALSMLTKWEFEDELAAIEEIVLEQRRANVQAKRALLLQGREDAPESPAKKKKR